MRNMYKIIYNRYCNLAIDLFSSSKQFYKKVSWVMYKNVGFWYNIFFYLWTRAYDLLLNNFG